MEEFKQFRDTRYFVSNTGKVRSHIQGNDLKTANHNGYRRISLRYGGGKYTHLVHRLVAECFLVDYTEELTVNHINGIRDDNNLENLEMMTLADNIRHSYESLGREQFPNSKPVNQYTLEGKFVAGFVSIASAARSVNKSEANISAVVNGLEETCAGYKWEFKTDYNAPYFE